MPEMRAVARLELMDVPRMLVVEEGQDEFPQPWAWYRADDLDAGSVFEWPDRAGGAGPVTNDTNPANDGDPDATYHVVASGIGGQPAVSAPLLGGWEWLEREVSPRETANGATLFAVVDTSHFWVNVRDVDPSWNAWMETEEVDATLREAFIQSTTPTHGSNSVVDAIPFGMPMALLAVFEPGGGDGRLYVNGIEVLSPIVSGTEPIFLLTWHQADPTTERDSLIAEVAVWTRGLDATEQGAVWAYVQDRYGIGGP